MTELQGLMDAVAAEWPFDAKNYPFIAYLKRLRERRCFALNCIAIYLSDHAGRLQHAADPIMHGKPEQVDDDAIRDNLWKAFRGTLRAAEMLGFNAETFIKFCWYQEHELQSAKSSHGKKPMRERHGARTRRG